MLATALLGLGLVAGCNSFSRDEQDVRDGIVRGKKVSMETTAYCPCGECCGWKLNWLGRAVHSSGRNRGKPKAVGITASGTKAKPGTIAADTRYYPFGTVIYVPGYGYGVVQDRGGDIRGRHRLDLFFNTHKEALRWGRQKIHVVVFPKGTPAISKNAPPPR
jgi:3D (Asp-Asp-Asp) domain-containing protein